MEDKLTQDRIVKLNNLREKGINPFPYTFDQTHHAEEIKSKYPNLKPEQHTGENVSVAGRVMLLRKMGKATFLNIQDRTGRIQVYVREEDVGEQYFIIRNLDVGDHLGIKGEVFATQKGELSIYAKEIAMQAKSFLPLPEKFHGLKDKELKYRERWLDLTMNPESKERFVKRSLIIKKMREFLDNKEFMEVETPVLQALYGGAEARPFKTHLHAHNMGLYLSISPELFLKRLIVGDLERVYTICKNFRNEDIDRWHNPEFTMMECYQAYADYNDIMKLTEDMVEFIVKSVNDGKTEVSYQGTTLDFKAPWKRITMYDAIKIHGGIDVAHMSVNELKLESASLNIEDVPDVKGELVQALFEEVAEKHLIQPTFVTDHPIEVSPLTKTHRDNPELVERFEAFVNGVELANAYSELNDPEEQEKRLQGQVNKRDSVHEEKMHELVNAVDKDFIKALKQGMPTLGGVGIGIDRLALFITDAPSIRDIVLFPFMKQIKED